MSDHLRSVLSSGTGSASSGRIDATSSRRSRADISSVGLISGTQPSLIWVPPHSTPGPLRWVP